jgi:hypothetical protein
MRRLNIHPGGVLDGTFVSKGSERPHVEDVSYADLNFKGPCSSDDFRKSLESTLFRSMSEGFEVGISDCEKCIPTATPPARSLITIKIDPRSLTIEQDTYNPQKLKAHFSDGEGCQMRYTGITDRGFFDYAQKHASESGSVAKINSFLHSQDELYLRLGLSREYQAPDKRKGYWIQLNGIYTFPNYFEPIRSYS